jgi:hypothetical protein
VRATSRNWTSTAVLVLVDDGTAVLVLVDDGTAGSASMRRQGHPLNGTARHRVRARAHRRVSRHPPIRDG